MLKAATIPQKNLLKNKSSFSNELLKSSFENVQKIGQGLTSTVYKATHIQTKQIVCLKVIHPQFYSKALGKSLIDNQISLLKNLKHPNILSFKENICKGQQNIIITEFYQDGNLYNLTRKKKTFSQSDSFQVINSIALGCSYLHQSNIIHRDLKPENIFVKNNQYVIADFGFAVNTDNTSLMKINAGSPLYMSPQALKDLKFSEKSDVFSIAVIWFELIKGYTPWRANSQKQLLNNILSKKPQISLKNKELQKILFKCLDVRPQNRLTISSLLEFITNFRERANQTQQYSGFSTSPSFCPSPLQSLKLSKNCINILQKSYIPSKSNKNDNKQNLNLSLNLSDVRNKQQSTEKTDRISKKKTNSIHKILKRNYSVIEQTDNLATKRLHKSQQLEKDFKLVLCRFDPQQMKFLPFSMIQKFKFILKKYEQLLIRQGNKDTGEMEIEIEVPKQLKHDTLATELVKCTSQKDLALKVSGYIGRMYRLAKNYKVCKESVHDIKIICDRVQGLCCC